MITNIGTGLLHLLFAAALSLGLLCGLVLLGARVLRSGRFLFQPRGGGGMSALTVWLIMAATGVFCSWAAYKLGHCHGWDEGRNFGRLIERSKQAMKKREEDSI